MNHGNPARAATAEPLNSRSEPAKETGAANHEETARPENTPTHAANVVHPKDIPARQPYTANTGNAGRDKKVQQQHDQMVAKQDQERQKLQQKQDQEHQRPANQNANEAGKQKLEQQHTQQTQQLQQKHTQQEQKLQSRVQPEKPKHG